MAERRANTLLAARRSEDAAWHGTAFIVEALLLLAFLAFSSRCSCSCSARRTRAAWRSAS